MKPNIFEQTLDDPVHKNLKIKCHYTVLAPMHIKKTTKQLCATYGVWGFKSFILILTNHHTVFAPWKKLEQKNDSNKNVISETRGIRVGFIAHISKKARRL